MAGDCWGSRVERCAVVGVTAGIEIGETGAGAFVALVFATASSSGFAEGGGIFGVGIVVSGGFAAAGEFDCSFPPGNPNSHDPGACSSKSHSTYPPSLFFFF